MHKVLLFNEFFLFFIFYNEYLALMMVLFVLLYSKVIFSWKF